MIFDKRKSLPNTKQTRPKEMLNGVLSTQSKRMVTITKITNATVNIQKRIKPYQHRKTSNSKDAQKEEHTKEPRKK